MRCPKCGYENPKGTELCQGCRRVRFVARKKTGIRVPKPASGATAVKPKSVATAVKPRSGATAVKRPGSRRTAAIAPASSSAPTQRRPRSNRLAAAAAEASPAKPRTRAWGSPPVKAGKHVLVRVGAPPIELEPGKTFTFGRNETCSLPIPSSRVSREHAVIRWDGGRPVLADNGSANGTYVGGRPVTEHALSPGDEIEIGPFVCVYRDREPPPAAAKAQEPLGGATLVDAGELLSGQIGDAGLAEVFQGIDFNKKTGTLFVFSPQGQGWVTFRDGAPQAGEAASGEKDAGAAFFLLALKSGRFSFTNELRTEERRVKTTVTGLLLEWGRRADEQDRGGESTRS